MKNAYKLSVAAILATSITWGVAQSSSELATVPPEAHAELCGSIQVAIANASKAWKDAFNSGDAEAAAALYEADAVMVAKPFGTYTGKQEILEFWSDLIEKGFDDVVYSNTQTTLIDAHSASISANWEMNNEHGIITNELWVIQADGRALLREDHFEVAQ